MEIHTYIYIFVKYQINRKILKKKRKVVVVYRNIGYLILKLPANIPNIHYFERKENQINREYHFYNRWKRPLYSTSKIFDIRFVRFERHANLFTLSLHVYLTR